MSGTLYLVSTPIGNINDLTLRAQRVLGEVDAVVCEERGVGAALLAHFALDRPLFELNEHTPPSEVDALLERLGRGEKLALISDHGTPLVQDPGGSLVQRAIAAKVKVEPVPGASAVLAALVASGLPTGRFRFIGLLPPKTEARRRALRDLKDVRDTFILLDAPYRLRPLLRAVRAELGADRRIVVACELTLPQEQFVRGTAAEVLDHFEREPFKGEFVVVVEGNKGHRGEGDKG